MVSEPGEDVDNLMMRATDGKQYKVVREVPAWSVFLLLASILTFGAGQALALWVGQREQQRTLTELTSRVIELTTEVSRLTEKINGKDMADIRHDLRLDDLGRRITVLERYHQGRITNN